MSDALNYIYLIYSGFIDFIFNRAEIFQNVTVGWVLIVITVFGLLIRSILNVPRGAKVYRRKED